MNLAILGLPDLVHRAAAQLASASSAAEVLEARDMASIAYDAAKKAGRLARAKQAHDEILVKAAHAQADALEIECMAKRRLADEYDAGQGRGEIRKHGERRVSDSETVGLADFPNMSGKDIYDARQIRDAEASDPGIIRRSLDAHLIDGEGPTRAALKRDITHAPPHAPIVSDAALWLWGRLRDFERRGYFDADPAALLVEMTEPMRADVRDVIGDVLAFLNKLNREISR